MNRQPHVDETRRFAIAASLLAAVAAATLGACGAPDFLAAPATRAAPREVAPGEPIRQLPTVHVVAKRGGAEPANTPDNATDMARQALAPATRPPG